MSWPPAASGQLLYGRGDRNPHRAKYASARALELRAQAEMLAVLDHFHVLQPFEVLQHVGPLVPLSPSGQPRLQFVTQEQRQERTEHVTTDRPVALMIDRPRFQKRLAGAKPMLHLPQLLELQRHLGRRQVRTRAQYPG